MPDRDELLRILGELAGEVSLCWIPKPSANGFDADKASRFVSEAVEEVMAWAEGKKECENLQNEIKEA